jgi:saccharopine dehydrogenase-like NADP-dependent oxidoreductase
MHNILILGAGKVGMLVGHLLAESNDYHVHLVDLSLSEAMESLAHGFSHVEASALDCSVKAHVIDYIETHRIHTIVSCLPYYGNVLIAEVACEAGVYYFDLTEDMAVTKQVRHLAYDSPKHFVPQCGLAPGFISIVTNHLLQGFDSLDQVKMRVGALPVNVSNALHYALTWSTAGLINEYVNVCHVLDQGALATRYPLEGLEKIKIDGLTYEAFHTSGGIGSLVQTLSGKVDRMDYKTIRYPGHCEKMRFLLHELGLSRDKALLQTILERALPHTSQDVVLVYVAVQGKKAGRFSEQNYTKKFYPQQVANQTWSAIQMSTASSVCAMIDLVIGGQVSAPQHYIRQEHVSLPLFLQNRFGSYFR